MKLFRQSDPQQRYMMFKYKCLFTNYVVVNEYVKKAFVTVTKQHVSKLCYKNNGADGTLISRQPKRRARSLPVDQAWNIESPR